MTGSPPKWFYAWALWMALGAAVGWVSLNRTHFPESLPARDPRPALSGNGQWLAVEWPRLDTAHRDVLRYHLDSGSMERIQRGFHGRPVNDSSFHPTLDRSGQRMAFSSLATDWVSGDDNSVSDIFLWEADRVQRLLPPHPEPGRSASYSPRLSPQGDRLAFLSYGWPGSNKEQGRQVCLWSSNEVRLLGPFSGPALGPVAFPPQAGEPTLTAFGPWGQLKPRFGLVSDGLAMLPTWPHPTYQPARAEHACFFVSSPGRHHQIYELAEGKAEPRLITQSTSGEEGNDSSFEPACSASGQQLVFTSYAGNLGANQGSHILLWQRGQGLRCLSQGLAGPHFHPAISEDGARVVWMANQQVYLWEQERGRRRLLPPP